MRETSRVGARLIAALLVVSGALSAMPVAASAEGRCGTAAWCSTALSPTQRADLMLAAMSQSDKVGILTGQAASDIGLPPITWTDGAVGAGGAGSGTSDATAMPAGIALAANFDQQMAYRYGTIVGTEVKHRGFDGDYGATVNIMRTPLGGRTYEAYGEDPFLAAQTAVGWIDGLQAQGVMADVKHFAENDQEGQVGVSPLFGVYGGRTIVDVHVDPRTMHEIELVPFEAAVQQAHSAAVMCSYNLVNGVYACANPSLLTTVLRQGWGFDGFVTSDLASCHETAPDMTAGLNFDIADTCYNAPEVDAALADGTVSQSLLNARAFEILRELFAIGFFDHPTWPKDISKDNVSGDEAVADQAEEGGAVLMKNNSVLPISAAKVRSIAVIGPAADQYIHGNGSSEVTPYVDTTALDGIEARAKQAGITVSYNDGSDPSSAESLAKSSDLAIVVAADTESEGVDKPCMSLVPQCSGGQATPPNPQSTQLDFGDQDGLIADVAAANPRTVVVLETGAPVLTPWRDQIAGLLEAWYPGEDGGTAIAHLLFGDVDPSGRLPATFPEQAGDIPTAHGGAPQYPGTVTPTSDCIVYTDSVPCPYYQEYYSEGVMVGYRWYQDQRIEPAFPFGFGLSYSRFRFSRLTVGPGRTAGSYVAHATVANTGSRSGSAVPELYVSLPSRPGVPEPPWQLKGFAKVQLAPGQSRRVSMPLDPRSFSYWSDAASGWRIARGCNIVAVGSSSASLSLRAVVAQGGAGCRSRRAPRRTARAAATAAAQPSSAPPSPDCVPRTSAVPGGPARLVQDAAISGYSGRLRDLTLYSPALSGDVHVDVLLPAGYSADSPSRYHVLYLLHGSGGSYTDWLSHGVAQILAAGSTASHLPPLIAVMPDGGLEGYYTDWYGRDLDQPNEGPSPGWATFDLDELIPYIDSHYRTIVSRSGRAIAGLSMGGFGATSLPARRPDMFAAAGSFSGADDIDYDYPYENALLYGTNPAFTGGAPDLCIWGDALTERVHWEAVDPTYLAQNLAPVDLLLASGDGTPGPYDSITPGTLADTSGAAATEADIWSMNQGFVAALDQAGVAHTDYFYGPGTHSWPYWERDLTHFLPFLATAWAHPKPAPTTFDYRSESSSFSLWGWSFTTHRSVAEFTYLDDVSRGGLKASGSGTLRVTTGRLYPPGSRWTITAAGHRSVVEASRSGRLSFAIELGPAHTAQQTSFPSDGAPPSGWMTVHAHVVRSSLPAL